MVKSCKKCVKLTSKDDAQYMTGDCVGCVDHSKFRLNWFAIDDDPTPKITCADCIIDYQHKGDHEHTICGHFHNGKHPDDPKKTHSQRIAEFYAENLDLKSMFLQTEISKTDNDDPTPDYYNYRYKDIKFDPYRGGDIFGITCPALFQAWKKIIRAGKDAKSYKEDIMEARNALNRKLEMLEEDENDNTER